MRHVVRAATSALLIAGAASSPWGTAAAQPRAQRPRPGDVRVVERVRELFPQARGWFRIVADARFDTGSDGRLVPDFSTLQHTRVRRADAAGHSLLPRYPRSLARPIRVGSSEDDGLYVEVLARGARAVEGRVEDGLVVYRDAYVDTDVLYKSTPTHVDEYLLIRSRAAPSRWLFRVQRGPAIAALRQSGSTVEAVDARGVAWLRAAPPFAVDRTGRRVTGTIQLDGDNLLLDIDLREFEPPILVDPDWKSTADMAYGRFYHGAGELPDGRVLVTGGCSASVCSGSLGLPACPTIVKAAETLDLTTRNWSVVAQTAVGRFFHAMERLGDGRMLVVGGCTDSACGLVTETAELFDPAKSVFSPTGALAEARAGSATMVLADGSVLVAGGCNGTSCSQRVERYLPGKGTFVNAAVLHTARGRATATRLPDGRVAVVGGCTNITCDGVLDDAEIYDPVTDAWTTTGAMSIPRAGHFAALLADGRVLVGGGCVEGSCAAPSATAEVLDPIKKTFSPVGALQQPRFGVLAVPLPNGQVLVSQGCSNATTCDLTNELYWPATGTFSAAPTAITARAFHTLQVHPETMLAVAVGGCQPKTCSWWNETFDLSGFTGPTPDGGAPEAGAPEAGPPAQPDAGASGQGGGGAGGAGMTGGGMAGAAVPGPTPTASGHWVLTHHDPSSSGGCGVRDARAPRGSGWIAVLALAGLALRRRRSRA